MVGFWNFLRELLLSFPPINIISEIQHYLFCLDFTGIENCWPLSGQFQKESHPYLSDIDKEVTLEKGLVPKAMSGTGLGLWALLWSQWLGFPQQKREFFTAVNSSLLLWLFIWALSTLQSSHCSFFVSLAVLKQLKWSVTRAILFPLRSRFMMLLSPWHGELTSDALCCFYSSVHDLVWISTTGRVNNWSLFSLVHWKILQGLELSLTTVWASCPTWKIWFLS